MPDTPVARTDDLADTAYDAGHRAGDHPGTPLTGPETSERSPAAG